MTTSATAQAKGGAWLLEEPPASVFTPEQLSDEHRLVAQTTDEFVRAEVLPNLERLENKDWDLARHLIRRCGELGLLGVPAFVFQEGHDPIAEQAFREIARLTRGAYCRFDLSAAHELAELLRAAAVYAAGGFKALADLSAKRGAGAQKLLAQMSTR